MKKVFLLLGVTGMILNVNSQENKIESTGNVGIGTTNPKHKLDVNGNIENRTGEFYSEANAFVFRNNGGAWTPINSRGINIGDWVNSTSYGEFITGSDYHMNFKIQGVSRLFIHKSNGNVGIGTNNPSNSQGWHGVLDVAGSQHSKILATSVNATFKTGIFSHNESWHGGGGFVGTESNHNLHLITGYSPKMTILTNGNIGIGTKNPDMKLTVKGNIHAEEVKIDLNVPAPDYVFKDSYQLRSLEELENFIKDNSHLPEIPSAKDFKQNGIMQAEMDINLLKKIEELTLYTIQQEKKIKAQAKKIENLESLNNKFLELQSRLEKLELKE